MKDVTLKNPADLAARLDLESAGRVLLIDAPDSLQALLGARRPQQSPIEVVEAKAIRSIKTTFDAVLLWREDRVGSRSVLESAVKRLESSGVLWVVTAMKKVIGPVTPAAHRLERSDLEKAFAAEGFACDREVRVSAWHVGYRFVRREA